MKTSLSFLATIVLFAPFALLQTGCSSYSYGPAPVTYGPGYPVSGWGGVGFYSGSVYRGPGWNNNYYRGGSGSWNNNSGNWNTARGGSANWNNGSGSANGARGGSANWSHGSGSATGWRGGSANWGGGSGSWNSARGGSGSWHR